MRDPVYDIAYYGTGVYLYDKFIDGFIEGYKSIKSLPEDFYLRYWLYYVRISLAKAVGRCRMKTQNLKSLPPIAKRINFGLNNLLKISN